MHSNTATTKNCGSPRIKHIRVRRFDRCGLSDRVLAVKKPTTKLILRRFDRCGLSGRVLGSPLAVTKLNQILQLVIESTFNVPTKANISY
jgi:hypothetical protein